MRRAKGQKARESGAGIDSGGNFTPCGKSLLIIHVMKVKMVTSVYEALYTKRALDKSPPPAHLSRRPCAHFVLGLKLVGEFLLKIFYCIQVSHSL